MKRSLKFALLLYMYAFIKWFQTQWQMNVRWGFCYKIQNNLFKICLISKEKTTKLEKISHVFKDFSEISKKNHCSFKIKFKFDFDLKTDKFLLKI